jgi:hypothetical protein
MNLPMKKSVWLSFDLGIQGDYEGLYRWLDTRDARECGENLAYLEFPLKHDLLTEIKSSLKKDVEIDQKRARIYLIFRDDEEKKMKGKFLFGQRKAPPWRGFAPGEAKGEEDESAD